MKLNIQYRLPPTLVYIDYIDQIPTNFGNNDQYIPTEKMFSHFQLNSVYYVILSNINSVKVMAIFR